MKLEQVKSKIDKYFTTISSEELYKTLKKYGLKKFNYNSSKRNGSISRR